MVAFRRWEIVEQLDSEDEIRAFLKRVDIQTERC
jgi:hypothetical protein